MSRSLGEACGGLTHLSSRPPAFLAARILFKQSSGTATQPYAPRNTVIPTVPPSRSMMGPPLWGSESGMSCSNILGRSTLCLISPASSRIRFWWCPPWIRCTGRRSPARRPRAISRRSRSSWISLPAIVPITHPGRMPAIKAEPPTASTRYPPIVGPPEIAGGLAAGRETRDANGPGGSLWDTLTTPIANGESDGPTAASIVPTTG